MNSSYQFWHSHRLKKNFKVLDLISFNHINVAVLAPIKIYKIETDLKPTLYLLQALMHIEEVANSLGLRYSQKPRSPLPIVYGSEDELE